MHPNEQREAAAPGDDGLALRILIASEIRFLRESLSELLARDGKISVIGHCADYGEMLGLVRAFRPDMMLLDAAFRDGVLVVRRLAETVPELRAIVFALTESVESVLLWAEAGMAGYIPSTASSADLHRLVGDIFAGRQICAAPVAAGLLQRFGARSGGPVAPLTGAPALTPREFEVVRLIGTGLSNKEIARRLNIGLATTKSHVHNSLAKLNLQRRGQAAIWMHARSPLG